MNKTANLSPASVLCPACGSPDATNLLSAPDRYHGRRHFFHLVKCRSCELVWTGNAPGPDEIGKHYGPLYDRAIAKAGEGDHNRWRDRMRTLAHYKKGGAILDIGCSSGSFLSALQGKRWDLYGIEMSEEPAARARELCSAKIFVGDILDADFPPASFDVITCFHVFEHMYQPKAVLEKVSEWLKPGGIFYMLVPNIDSAGARIFGSYWYPLELPRHLFHFSPQSLRYLAKSAQLEVESLTTHREVYIEQSWHYVMEDFAGKIGIPGRCLAEMPSPSLPFRVVRKAFRLTVLPVLTGLASLVGDGESIHAVFRKRILE